MKSLTSKTGMWVGLFGASVFAVQFGVAL